LLKQLTTLAAPVFLLAHAAAGQDADAMSRWGKATTDALARFLPDASRWGMTVDPYPIFSGAAAETYVYQGANSMVRRYPEYIVHQTWWYDDAELVRQMAGVAREKAALKQELEKAGDEFFNAHGAEMKAAEKAHLAEVDKVQKEFTSLYQQGKTAEAQAALAKLGKLGAFVYPPYQALTDSFDKRQKELDSRERSLQNFKRKVNFQIRVNRTPTTTAPAFAPKLVGTLAGHPFYRQVRENVSLSDAMAAALVDLAVYLGPPGFQNTKVKIGTRDLAIKTVVVWALVESIPDRIKADEAARTVLESMDYEGLSKADRALRAGKTAPAARVNPCFQTPCRRVVLLFI